MMRFELITLAGPVFETGAYTVPPHRLKKNFCGLRSQSSVTLTVLTYPKYHRTSALQAELTACMGLYYHRTRVPSSGISAMLMQVVLAAEIRSI